MYTERKDKNNTKTEYNPLAQIQKISNLHMGTTSSPIMINRPIPNETTFNFIQLISCFGRDRTQYLR